MTEPPCTGLVERAQRGDVDAFSRLVTEFQDLAAGAAYGWLGDAETARDVSQEAFLDAWVNLGQLREPAAFPAWLRRIVRKHCDRVTRRPRPPAWSWLEHDGAASRGVDTADDTERLRLAVEALPPGQRLVVALHYFADLTAPELAAFLDLPLSTIKKRLHDARRRLREQGDHLMEKTMKNMRPSSTGEFAEVVTFFLAIRAGDRARVKAMLETSPGLVNAVQEWDSALVTDGVLPFPTRTTALITAIERDDPALLTLLLDAGADVDGECRCVTGESPVWAATVLDRRTHLRLLLERGSNPDCASRGGTTPLHVAAMRGFAAAARLLLDHGADRNVRDAQGRTAADWARANGHDTVARLLCASGAEGEVGRRERPAGENGAGVLFTGIKAVDLFCPLPRNGLVRLPFMAGVGLVVLLGELCRRVSLAPLGTAIWTGFSQRPFDFKDWQTEMSELGLTGCVQQSLADVDAGADARRAAFERGLEQAERASAEGMDVLLVITSDQGFESDVEASLARLRAARPVGSITALIVTTFPERAEAMWSRLTGPYAAQLSLHRPRARRGLYPSLDPDRCLSALLTEDAVGAGHLRIAGQARELLRRYAERDPAFESVSSPLAFMDPHLAGVEPELPPGRDEDGAAHALLRYLTQPFYVTEPFTGRPGEWVAHDALLDAVAALLT